MNKNNCLDARDKKIIRELNRNSRQSFASIGKKVLLPKNVVAYRIKNLEEKGIITLFNTTINRTRLGYLHSSLFLKFRFFSEVLEKRFTKFLREQNSIHFAATLEGNFDFEIVFLTKSIGEMQDIYDSIIYKFGDSLIEKELILSTKLYYLPYNYLYEDIEKRFNVLSVKDSIEEIDNKDLQIINLLKKNSRISTLELSSKIKLSPEIIRLRIKKLINKKVIHGFNIRIDFNKFKLNHFCVFLNLSNIDLLNLEKMINFLLVQKSVIKITKGIGKYDLSFESILESHFELHDLLKNLKEKFPDLILKQEFSFICRIHDVNTAEYY